MTLQEVITKVSDLDPEKDYNLSLTGDKLNIETAGKENPCRFDIQLIASQ